MTCPPASRPFLLDPRGWTTCVTPPRVDHVGGVDDLGLPVSSGSFRAIRILIGQWGRGSRSDLGFLGVSGVPEGSNSV
jgi:hypothetical protein